MKRNQEYKIFAFVSLRAFFAKQPLTQRLLRAKNALVMTLIDNDRKQKMKFKLSSSGQTMVEFTFSLIIVLLMIYGLMKVFEWTGKDQVMRRIAHDTLIFSQIKHTYDNEGDGPLKQMDPYFYTPISMNAIWDGK